MIHIKSQHPSKLEATYTALFNALWQREIDLSKTELLTEVLGEVFSASEVEAILAASNTEEVKTQLTKNTTHAWQDLGAFGAPWFWLTNGEGKQEALFGSDRWAYM